MAGGGLQSQPPLESKRLCTAGDRRGSKKNDDKKWDSIEWLRQAYEKTSQDNGDLPAFEDLIFGDIPDDLLEHGKKLLAILELCEFKWTLNDILDQPEQELNLVFYLKNLGEKIRIQNRSSGVSSADPQTVYRLDQIKASHG